MASTVESKAVSSASRSLPDITLRFLAWVWFGMVVGVSLIATPAKFQAESLELEIALDVGRTTFGLFNWAQWIALVIVAAVVARAVQRGQADRRHWLALAGVAVILVAQTLWILPALNDRVAIVIAGDELPDSPIHTIFGLFEGSKLLLLGLLGFMNPRNKMQD